jgi:enediyne biosynthesis protein E3
MKPTLFGSVRNAIFAPDPSEVTFERRGFEPVDPARQANLEKVGGIFLEGFRYGMGGGTLTDIEAALETVEEPFRGFAYEGCAMALAVRDGLVPGGGHWIRDFLAGRGAAHIYMVYVGVGWAMARLPRIRWRAIMPDDDLLRWLALDGYGFHQAYFHTQRYIAEQQQRRIPRWEPGGYANRAADQGIGRALWFINGSDVGRLAAGIAAFAPQRRGDLWSGAGLASVYAGGVEAADLEEMAELAGEYRPDAAQGAAFAAKARLLAGLVIPHTHTGAGVFCGMSVAEAAAVCDEAREGLPETSGEVPAYEVWRQRIRKRFEQAPVRAFSSGTDTATHE